MLLLAFAALLASAQAQPIVAGFERFHAGATDAAQVVDGGFLLLNELNCVACHAPPAAWRAQLPGRAKISLLDVGHRLGAADVAEFLRDPQKAKPGTSMPAMLGDDAAATEALAVYLSGAKSSGAPKTYPSGDPARGHALYVSIGCSACHAPTEGTAAVPSIPLGLARRYARDALAAFLQDPLQPRPAGRMPAFELSDAEAADLAAFLQRESPVRPAPATAPGIEPGLAHGLLAGRNCLACHDDGSGAAAREATPLGRVRVDQGCLAIQVPAATPQFALGAAQRRALASAIRALQASPAPPARSAEQRLVARLEQLNCYACHEFRGRGGPDAVRAKFFVTTDSGAESLGELAHLPPRLDAAGRKLTPAWLGRLLWGSAGGVRPYMTARMPRFGQSAADDLVALFEEACRPASPQRIDTSGAFGHQRFATGRTLIGGGNGGIGCVACHGLGETNPAGVRSINLTHTATRLQPEYFKALLLDPQGLQPGTIMPPLLAGRKNADKEIESIWTYLREFEHNPRLPEGLGASGANELRPEQEGRPIVFRTFLEGAGTHAIAVGFPEKMHAAFDAYEVHWALVWRGRFLDATSKWEERTMPPTKSLGEAVTPLPTWMPFARLTAPTAPWPTDYGSAAGYVFKGYRLGVDGTPVFRYRVGALEVEDALQPAAGRQGFRRHVTVHGAGEGWYFRGAGKNAAPQPIVWHEGVATFEEEIAF